MTSYTEYTEAKPATSERIAAAALHILEAEGAPAVTMRRVADAAGITAMAIYHHFPSREALLDSITDREFANLVAYLESVPRSASVESTLIETALAYLDYAL